MMRNVAAVGLFAILILATPAFAVTTQQKMATCKFGADNQKLTGPARKTFITRCMANEDAPADRAKTDQEK
jgi:psiF repeat